MTRFRALAIAGVALPLALTAPVGAQVPKAAPPAQQVRAPADPYIWLEDVEGARSMAWVKAHNAKTVKALSADARYAQLYARILGVLNSKDRIPFPAILGDRLYNFWQDAANPRGIWRSTSWESYVAGSPQWRTVLDVDSLAKAEKVAWAWKGASCLRPEYRLCLVNLSRGGADAVEVREFDASTGRFVADGFKLPEAKQDVAWIDADNLLVASNFGEGTLTTSGYARIAKLWHRGTPLAAAKTLLEGKTTDMAVGVGSEEVGDRLMGIVSKRPSFFEGEYWVLRDTGLVKVDMPLDADPSFVGDQVVLYLRSPWEVGGKTFPAASLLYQKLDSFLAGGRDFQLLTQAGPRQTIQGVQSTRDYLLVSMLDNVRPKLLRFRPAPGVWAVDTVPAPDLGSVGIAATSPGTNRFFFVYTAPTQPTTLYLAGEDGKVQEVKRLPAQFDAAGLVVEQKETTSKDGTRIPYFLVHRKDVKLDGRNPTLLNGYGGFEIAMTPTYNPTIGSAWLERGGVFALANIRGGGEFGPTWHRAAMREKRQRAYEDFIAVGEDLVKSGVTSPAHLGIMGGSNGGLLMGAMLTQRPDLWHAVVIMNPLLDMYRYSHLLAGASWMGEYGNPDVPADWAFISKYSPYQNLRAGMKYPRPFIVTTTRDDRVHPGHARKFAAKLEALGYPFDYFENTEGGHGSGVTSEQQARELALIYTYLWERLGTPARTASAAR